MATQPGRATNDVDYRITLGAYVNARLQVNPKAFRIPTNNQLDIYIVRDFLQERPPQPNREIVEHGFFSIDALPEETTRATRARIDEVFRGVQVSETW